MEFHITEKHADFNGVFRHNDRYHPNVHFRRLDPQYFFLYRAGQERNTSLTIGSITSQMEVMVVGASFFSDYAFNQTEESTMYNHSTQDIVPPYNSRKRQQNTCHMTVEVPDLSEIASSKMANHIPSSYMQDVQLGAFEYSHDVCARFAANLIQLNNNNKAKFMKFTSDFQSNEVRVFFECLPSRKYEVFKRLAKEFIMYRPSGAVYSIHYLPNIYIQDEQVRVRIFQPVNTVILQYERIYRSYRDVKFGALRPQLKHGGLPSISLLTTMHQPLAPPKEDWKMQLLGCLLTITVALYVVFLVYEVQRTDQETFQNQNAQEQNVVAPNRKGRAKKNAINPLGEILTAADVMALAQYINGQ